MDIKERNIGGIDWDNLYRMAGMVPPQAGQRVSVAVSPSSLNAADEGSANADTVTDLRSGILVDWGIDQALRHLQEGEKYTAEASRGISQGLTLFKNALPRMLDVQQAYRSDTDAGDESYRSTKEAICHNLTDYVGEEAATNVFDILMQRNVFVGVLYLALGPEIIDSAKKDIPRALADIQNSLNLHIEDGRLQMDHGQALWNSNSQGGNLRGEEYDWVRKQKSAFEVIRGTLVSFRESAREYLMSLAHGIRSRE